MQSLGVKRTLANGALSNLHSAWITMGMEAPETPQIDVNSIRKANLRRLIAQCGSVSSFAEQVDTNADYVSSIIADGGKRNPGDQLMRRVEVAFKLTPGSLDFPEEQSMAAALAIQSLPKDEQQQVFDFITYKIHSTEALTAREHIGSYLKMIANLRQDMDQKRGRKPKGPKK